VTRQPELVLSLFPGIDLLGRAFEDAGFCVVRGPDLITGGDVRRFRGFPGKFDGIIGGPPCQGFSCMNTQRTNADHPSVVNSRAMLGEFVRIVGECQPDWFLLENVPGVPDVRVPGYSVQRIAISDEECGGVQVRMRHVQFGGPLPIVISPKRVNDRKKNGKKSRMGRPLKSLTTKQPSLHIRYADHCRKQGFEPIKLPGWRKSAKFRAIGNGVPYALGWALSEAVKRRT